ncbi:hypothetical protein BDU57DRAFT_524092 [Ampelomyces quisqualis]|uniref:Uncharacterized protein n=1 Tax=Ampelomyces quisqualis TaxID=50730 RepID=A0A6A5QAK8_AMPQU|nr:hypothetical protein BDU57DRAFT_524092 [Ampelomyces quisqualis]
MPAPTSCPISEVDRALSVYINSREDTLRIRRTLSRYLTTSLRPVTPATKNQHLNHECPHNISLTPTNPPGLKASRLEYLQALRAHVQVQAKHKELQASLEDLQQRHVDNNPTQAHADYDNGSTQNYISLLRQRRCLAELQAIQESLDKLLTARPYPAAKDPKKIVKETIGEQPDLPAERLEHLSQSNDDQTWVYKLKQEVLESRANMDRTKVVRAEAQKKSYQTPTLFQQVHALECARDDIIEWIQGELAKVEEDSIFLEDTSPIKRPPNTTTAPADLDSAESRIKDVYDQYTSSRATLIEAYETLQQKPHIHSAQEAEQQQETLAANQPRLNSSRPISSLFPHMPHILHSSTLDRSLLQQSVYLLSQIASADQDVEDALLRLSGESHLLPAGSKDVKAWGEKAVEAERETEHFVQDNLLKAREEVSGVGRVVEMVGLRGSILGGGGGRE